MMSTFAATEATAAHSSGETGRAEHTAPSKHAPDALMVDMSADASTLQRFQNDAGNSPRAQQLKHQAEMMAASPAAMTLQRFRQMVNSSPQALQLKRQAQIMAADAADAVAAPGAVLQAVWEPQLEQAGMYQWDAVIDGKQWYYNASTNKYRYAVVDEAALTFDGLNDAFGVDGEELEDRELMTGKVNGQAGKDLDWGYYLSDADSDTLRNFDAKAFMQPLTDPVSKLCLDYCLLDDEGALEKAISAELGDDAAKIHGPLSWFALSGAFKAQLEKTHFKPTGNGKYFGFGTDQYSVDEGEYGVSPSQVTKLTLRQVLRQALWASMGHEIGDLTTKDRLQNAETALDPLDQVKVGNMDVRFTRRVQADRRGDCLELVNRFHDLIAGLTADNFEAIMKHQMVPTFKMALDEKDRGIGNKPSAGNADMAGQIGASEMLTEENLKAYCGATVRRWHALLESHVLVVFDAAGFEGVYGKTPASKDATPANLMTGPAEGSSEEPGFPASTYVLINVESPDNIITLAHELAHVIGFNPTDVEDSGHFTDSSRYRDAEAEYGPKLLFDAYYFEVLFRLLSEG